MLENLSGKKIAIVGLGTNNKKLAEYLTHKGIKYDVIDGWENADELKGKLDDYNYIFRTPGLPFLSEAVQQALKHGAVVSSQTKLFFELCPAPIIGVTGTKGKGTTSSLLAKICEAAGKRSWLGGNIGKDPFEFLESVKPNDLVILELSSFQLQDMEKSPHIAVVLNITADHLDHHRSVEEYVKAKSSMVAYQNKTDFTVLHPALPDWFKQLGNGQKIIFDPRSVTDFQSKLLGTHNYENIAAAVAVAKILKIEEAIIRKAVSEFETLPHHLQIIRELDQVTYVDDAVSTNIDTASAAISAIKAPIVLIVGGHDKGLDFTELGKKIAQAPNIKGLVVIGEVKDKILKAAAGFRGQVLTGGENMSEILDQARSIAKAGDTILISPATDSFDMFKNMYDRADQFVSEVNKLE